MGEIFQVIYGISEKIRLWYQIYFDVSFNPNISHAFSDLQKKNKSS